MLFAYKQNGVSQWVRPSNTCKQKRGSPNGFALRTNVFILLMVAPNGFARQANIVLLCESGFSQWVLPSTKQKETPIFENGLPTGSPIKNIDV